MVARLPVSKGALLHHFPSKAELLRALVDEAGERFAGAVEALAAKDPHPVGRFSRAYLAATVQLTMSEDEVRTSKVVLVACLLEPELADRWRWWTDQITRDEPNDAVGADDLPADEPGLHPAAAEGDGRPGQRGHEGDHHDHDRDAPAEGPADKPVPLLHRRTQLVPGEG